jgi:hypothetical protein
VCTYKSIAGYKTQCSVKESDDSTALSGNCDVDVDECASKPCKNGATCVESTSAIPGAAEEGGQRARYKTPASFHAYQCECEKGFANGVCKYNFVSQYSTECDVLESSISTRLSGNCDIDVNECKSSPCKHGGTCSDSTTKSAVSINAYQCTCAPGFANGVCKYNYINECKAECSMMESDDSTA